MAVKSNRERYDDRDERPRQKDAEVVKVLQAKVDSAKVLELGARLKKLMAAPENIRLAISDVVEMSAEYAGGSVILKSPEAVLEPAKGTISVLLPFAVLNAALHKRGPVKLSLQNNQLIITGQRYKAELNIERGGKMEALEPIKGQDSEPMRKLLKDAAGLLYITDMIEGQPIDVHFRWDKNGITAAAADPYHAVIIEGDADTKSAHRVTLPIDLAMKLSEIGGTFDIGETKVRAESELGRAEMNQVAASESVVPLESILGLLDLKPSWKAELNGTDLSALLSNLGAVVEGSDIEFDISEDSIAVDSKGRFGKVSGNVEISGVKGKPPGRITVRPSIFNSIVEKVHGNIRMEISGSILRIEPLKQKGDYDFYGFVHLKANA